jgi:P-type Ca2+ transporter type 2C
VMTTQMDMMRRLLDTAELTMPQFSWALVPPVVLLLLWELGKVFLRRGAALTTASTTFAG